MAAKEANLKRLREHYQARDLAEVKDKPDIGYQSSERSRTPVHLRDGTEAFRKRDEIHYAELQRKKSKELDGCTFSPEVNGKNDRGEDKCGRTAEGLIEWQKERDERVALLRMAVTDKGGENCTFKPQITEKSRKIVENQLNGGMPIKKGKREYIEEYIKKEKQDFFKPKINQNARMIAENGYNPASPRNYVKPLSPRNASRSKSVKSVSSAKPKPTIHKPKLNNIQMTEDDIKQRYRKEAFPERGFGKVTSKEYGYQIA